MRSMKSMTTNWLPVSVFLVSLTLVLAGCSGDAGAGEADAAGSADAGSPAATAPPARAPRAIPAGTTLTFEIGQTLSASGSQAGQTFPARLAQAVVVGGETLIPAGAAAEGRVLEAAESGRVSGVATIQLTMTTITLGGQTVDIATAPFEARAETSRTEDAVTIGAGTGIGAAIGGILGGGDGAALGAAIGGGGGTAVVLSTRGDNIELPSGTAVNFVLSNAAQLP
jgi:hypothetical protein